MLFIADTLSPTDLEQDLTGIEEDVFSQGASTARSRSSVGGSRPASAARSRPSSAARSRPTSATSSGRRSTTPREKREREIDEATGKRKALVSTVTPMEKKRIMSVFSRLDKDHLFFYAASLHEVNS